MDGDNITPVPRFRIVEEDEVLPEPQSVPAKVTRQEAVTVHVIKLDSLTKGSLLRAILDTEARGIPIHAAVRLNTRTGKLTFAWEPD